MLKINIRNVLTLIKMQLKERFQISVRKDIVLKSGLYLAFFAIITGVIYLIFYLFGRLGLFSLNGWFPISQLNLLLYFIFIILIISGVKRFTESLFDAKDNSIFLSLPLQPNEIYLSKFVVFYINELARDFLMMLPLLIAYGIANFVVWYYYIWIIIAFLVFILLVTSISGFISLGYVHIRSFLKKYELIRGLIILLILVAFSVLMFYIINLLPEDLQIMLKWATVYYPAITNFSKTVELIVYPLTFISGMFFSYAVGGNNNPRNMKPFGVTSILCFTGILVVSAILVVVTFILIKPLFLKMSAKQVEQEQKKQKTIKNTKRGKTYSLIYHEIIGDIREPKRLLSNYLMFIVTPMSTLILNAVFKSMHTSVSGMMYIFTLNIAFIVLITCSTNFSLASIYSKEGKNGDIEKTYPIDYREIRLSKAFVRAGIMTLSIILTVLIFYGKTSLTHFNVPVMIIVLLFVYYGHLLWSLELDYLKPKNRLYNDIGSGEVINTNEIISFILALTIALLIAFIAFFLINESSRKGYYHLLAVALLFFVSRLVLYLRNLKAFNNYIEDE